LPCIHAESNDVAFRGLSQLGGIVRGSFQETAPGKTAENTKVRWYPTTAVAVKVQWS